MPAQRPFVFISDGQVGLGWTGGVFSGIYDFFRIEDNYYYTTKNITSASLYAKVDNITAAVDPDGVRFYPISSAFLDFETPADPNAGHYSIWDVQNNVHAYALLADWDPATVKKKTLPPANSIVHGIEVRKSPYVGVEKFWRSTIADASEIQKIYHYGVVLRDDGLTIANNPLPEVSGGRYNADPSSQFSADTYSPHLTVFFASNEKIHMIPTGVPSTGYINTAAAQQFRWSLAQSLPALESPAQTGAVIEYYNTDSETAATAHSVTISGDTQAYTFPANSFVGGGLTWRVTITDETGVSTSSPWYSLETGEALPTAVPLSPINSVVDPSGVVTFDWNHVISTGTAPTKADVQISQDAETWTDFATVTGAATEYQAPAYTLVSGTYYWRVRSYNSVNVAGGWSKYAAFVALGAPKTPSLSATNKNRPTLTWTTEEQSAFEARIDGKDSVKVYGTARSYIWHDFLTSGTHLVELRVQNAYGYWSDWAQWTITAPADKQYVNLECEVQENDVALTFYAHEATIYGTNVETAEAGSGTPTITTQPVNYTGAVGSTARFTVVAEGDGLTYQWWYKSPGASSFARSSVTLATYSTRLTDANSGRQLYCIITDENDNSVRTDTVVMQINDPVAWWLYRDGAKIAELNGNPGSFVDRFAPAGVHRYTARPIFSGNYDSYMSADEEATIELDSIILYDLLHKVSIECPYTADGDGEIGHSYSRDSAQVHYNSEGYPVLDIGKALSETYKFNPVFPDGELRGSQITALAGLPVHVRDPYGAALFGSVDGISQSRYPDRETMSVQIGRIALTEVEANAI